MDESLLTHAQLTKLSTLPDGVLDPNGAATGGPIHEGYTVKGYYNLPPQIGSPFVISRYERNGIRIAGVMQTSPVTSIRGMKDGGTQFTTQNSIYQLITLPYEQEKQV